MTPTNDRQKAFEALKQSLRDLSPPHFYLLRGATCTFKKDEKYQCSVTRRVGPHHDILHFVWSFAQWDSFTKHERLFMTLHLCQHLLSNHFTRLRSKLQDKNTAEIAGIAINLAANHTILHKFNFKDSDLPTIRQQEAFVDTVYPELQMSDKLSAEEYFFILNRQREQEEQQRQEEEDAQDEENQEDCDDQDESDSDGGDGESDDDSQDSDEGGEDGDGSDDDGADGDGSSEDSESGDDSEDDSDEGADESSGDDAEDDSGDDSDDGEDEADGESGSDDGRDSKSSKRKRGHNGVSNGRRGQHDEDEDGEAGDESDESEGEDSGDDLDDSGEDDGEEDGSEGDGDSNESDSDSEPGDEDSEDESEDEDGDLDGPSGLDNHELSQEGELDISDMLAEVMAAMQRGDAGEEGEDEEEADDADSYDLSSAYGDGYASGYEQPKKSATEVTQAVESAFALPMGTLAGMGVNGAVKPKPIKVSSSPAREWRKFAYRLEKSVRADQGGTSWLPNKRFLALSHLNRDGLCMPSYRAPKKAQLRAIVFLDTSGSCTWMVHTFLTILASIPKEIFQVTSFTFTTEVMPFDIRDPVYRGGGTSFSDLELFFDNEVRKDRMAGKQYQHYAFVLTDGEGSHFAPKNPKQWFFLMNGVRELMDSKATAALSMDYARRVFTSTTRYLHPDVNVVPLEPFLPDELVNLIENGGSNVGYPSLVDRVNYLGELIARRENPDAPVMRRLSYSDPRNSIDYKPTT